MASWQSWELDEIHQWSLKKQSVFLSVCWAIAFIAAIYFWLSPLKNQINQAENTEQQLKIKIKHKAQQLARLVDIKNQVKTMEIAYQELAKLFPLQEELAHLLSSINLLAKENNLRVKRMDWQVAKQYQHWHQLPLRLEMIGSYADFGTFSAQLAKLSLIMSLQELIVQTRVSKNEVLEMPTKRKLHFSLVAFTYHTTRGQK